TTTEAVSMNEPVGEIDVPYFSSWADVDRDLTAWLGNEMQREAFDAIRKLEHSIKAFGNKVITDSWRKLMTSDHFYYMCTKWFADGDIHKYFNDYNNPYDAFTNFMNIVMDLRERVKETQLMEQPL
ncbi:MAG: alpha-amylase, partial [Candidatus Altiarchaeota archaeon]|nr:alpha-amylase [Candidatus Altiarchaeota archaeon]